MAVVSTGFIILLRVRQLIELNRATILLLHDLEMGMHK